MSKYLQIALLILFTISSLSVQGQKPAKDPAGQWKLSAPYAPEGFNTGTVTVNKAEKAYDVSMKFNYGDFTLSGEDVVFRNDSLMFFIFVEGAIIDVALKLENGSRMTGAASTPDGPIPVSLEKTVAEELKN